MVRRFIMAFAAAACLGLGACGSFNPVRDVLVATGAGAEPKPAPDFIAQSRPAETGFQPVGVAPPNRALQSKTPGDVKKVEAEMDALRTANEARADKARRAGAATPPAAPASK